MVEVNIQIQRNESGYIAYSPDISDQPIEGQSLDSVVNEIKELLRNYLDAANQTTPKTTGQSLLSMFDEITDDMSDDEIAQLPHDGAEQYDHYICGTLNLDYSRRGARRKINA